MSERNSGMQCSQAEEIPPKTEGLAGLGVLTQKFCGALQVQVYICMTKLEGVTSLRSGYRQSEARVPVVLQYCHVMLRQPHVFKTAAQR